jgi:hypothetical protein
MRWAGYVARMGRNGMHRGFWWESQKEKRPVRRPRHRWKDNIRVDFRDIERGAMERIHLAEDRDQWRVLVNTVMNLRIS